MKGILIEYSQGIGKIDIDGVVKEYRIKQSKKNEIRAENLEENSIVEFDINPLTGRYEIKGILEKNAITGNRNIMVVMSTGNQTVNAIPVDILNIDEVIILNTNFSKKRGFTKNLVDYFKRKKINFQVIHVDEVEEVNVNLLANKIKTLTENTKQDRCYINITGGQKIYAVAAAKALENFEKNKNFLLYLDAHNNFMYVNEEKKKYDSQLNLEDILNLYGYTYIKSDSIKWNYKDLEKHSLIQLNKLVNKFINDDNISKKFFVSKTLNEQNNIKRLYKNLERTLESLEELELDNSLYRNYMNQFKKIYRDEIDSPFEYKEKENQVKELLKVVNLNTKVLEGEFGEEKNPSIGGLFEKLVLSKVLKSIEGNDELKKNIKEIYTTVKTVKNEGDITKNSFESEYDVVLVTTKGTLLILEVKSGKYDGDTVKGKEYGAISKSGPYGRSAIVGPLINRFIDKNGNSKVEYVSSTIINHENVCQNTGIKYIRFDNIEESIKSLI